jgi:KaiC/GvpD/RAD55 family RecA-like ATPase
MMELPADSYFEANAAAVAQLTGDGFEGVYVSFQRPFGNVSALLKQRGVDTGKLVFIDVATALGEEEHERHSRCIHVSEAVSVDELVRAVHTGLGRIGGKRKFVFVDSLTTITLHKPLSESMRFCEFLVSTAKVRDSGLVLVLSVAKELRQKRFIEDVAVHADEVIGVR